MENNEAEQKRGKIMIDHKSRLRECSDSNKCNNICITGVSEEYKLKGAEGISEKLIKENFPNLGNKTDI